MKKWEHTTREARSAFSRRAYTEAIALDRIALVEAKSTFKQRFIKAPHQSLAAVMVSFFNLADDYQAIRDIIGTCQQYQAALAFLQWVEQHCLINLETEQAVLSGANQLYKEWMLFQKYVDNNVPLDLAEAIQIVGQGFRQLSDGMNNQRMYLV